MGDRVLDSRVGGGRDSLFGRGTGVNNNGLDLDWGLTKLVTLRNGGYVIDYTRVRQMVGTYGYDWTIYMRVTCGGINRCALITDRGD